MKKSKSSIIFIMAVIISLLMSATAYADYGWTDGDYAGITKINYNASKGQSGFPNPGYYVSVSMSTYPSTNLMDSYKITTRINYSNSNETLIKMAGNGNSCSATYIKQMLIISANNLFEAESTAFGSFRKEKNI